MMSHDRAMALLGHAADPARPESIRKAYATAVMTDHPDHGGSGLMLAKLREARDFLLSSGNQNDHTNISPCILCSGSGKVRGRFGAQRCIACEGSGDQL